jgi:hypothetical protein
MLPTHRVRVVARLRSDVQVFVSADAAHRSDPRQPSPEWDTSAIYWDTSEGSEQPVRGIDVGQTLTVIYEAEGRNASEAALFARAIFEWEWKRTTLPLPTMLAVFPEETTAI